MDYLKRVFLVSYLEFKNDNTQSFLDFLWHTINFALFIGGISIVFLSILGNSQVNILTYLTINFILWNFLNDSIMSLSNVFRARRGIIENQNVSLIFTFNVVYVKNLYKLLSSLPVLIFVTIFENSFNPQNIYLLIINVLLFFLFVYSTSLLSSIICMLIIEFQLLINFAMRLLFFLTPIFWFAREGKFFDIIFSVNPIFHFIEGIRVNIFELNNLADTSLIYTSLLSFIITILAIFLFKKLQNNLILNV